MPNESASRDEVIFILDMLFLFLVISTDYSRNKLPPIKGGISRAPSYY